MRRFFMLLFLLFFLSVFLSSCSTERTAYRFESMRIGLFDTVVSIIGYADNAEQFDGYAQAFFTRLEELHRLFDIFNPYDGTNNLYTVNKNAGVSPVSVSWEIIELLENAKLADEITGGAVNAALGPVLRIWHTYRSFGMMNPAEARLPSVYELRAAADLAVMDYVIIDRDAGTVFIERAWASVDVGAIAKGFAAGLAVEAATSAGARTMLVSAGGHIIATGVPPGRDGWNIGIHNPLTAGGAVTDSIMTTDTSVSISGGYQRYFTVDGFDFGHIIDPVSLFPADRFLQVAVAHPVSWMADILSTALFILPREEGEALAAAHGAEAFWVDVEVEVEAE